MKHVRAGKDIKLSQPQNDVALFENEYAMRTAMERMLEAKFLVRIRESTAILPARTRFFWHAERSSSREEGLTNRRDAISPKIAFCNL
ncbi:hypothetical protein H7B90_18660 [Cohnella xylanilytica]|uniref:Uncharacterized protein n=1 Tax=Cohnella xylanilytica TaxID=557555 RepID=A0A841TYV3_9BACL|nr:hypothetical protein [Cohnella xylanilytica]MBB6693415.1 hypothetical protein [Cohnella xylanilytica]